MAYISILKQRLKVLRYSIIIPLGQMEKKSFRFLLLYFISCICMGLIAVLFLSVGWAALFYVYGKYCAVYLPPLDLSIIRGIPLHINQLLCTYLRVVSINCRKLWTNLVLVGVSCPFSSLVKIYRPRLDSIGYICRLLYQQTHIYLYRRCCVQPQQLSAASAVCMQKKYTHTQISKGKNISSCPFFSFLLLLWAVYSISSCVYNGREIHLLLSQEKQRESKKKVLFPFVFLLDSPQIYICWGAEK